MSSIAWSKDRLDSLLGWAGVYQRRYVSIWKKRHHAQSVYTQWHKRHNAIFIHVPKAAGSSVKQSLGMPDLWPHCPAKAYCEIDPTFYRNAFTFAFVRNPWDRLVSAFHFINFSSENEYSKKIRHELFSDVESFDNFLEKLKSASYRGYVLTKMHFMPQVDFLCDYRGKVIVDAVGRFENLDDDFFEFAARIGVSDRIDTRNVGHNRNKDYREYYDLPWKVDLIRDIYRSDITLFGYQFDC